jgi:hypothetical protein
LISLVLAAGCAGGEDPPLSSGGGGEAGAVAGGAPEGAGGAGGGTGGTTTEGGSPSVGGHGGAGQGGEGEGGAPPNLCGNGVRDQGEACDLDDFGGLTCVDFGMSGGTLVCNQFCGVVVSGCLPAEACNDGQDNDADGAIDCLDDDCAEQLTCTDPCGAASPQVVPAWPNGNLAGRPNVLESSCAPGAGSEIVYQVTAAMDGDMSIQLYSWSFDGVISVRTACNDAQTELLCVDNAPNGQNESASFPAVAGETYFVIFEAKGAGSDFSGQIDQPLPESWCDGQWDDDFDGYLDCDDPSNCKGQSLECSPGPNGYGASCFQNNQCQATGGDPICLNWNQGFNSGYCSEFCDGPGDCPGGVCVDLNISVHGVCFKSCATDADCPNGLSCNDDGQGTLTCGNPPELNCQDYQDNDFDSLEDCEDATACAASFSCTPGVKAAGTTCQIHNQCAANAPDPICIDQFNFGWPGGYCSEFCDLAADDCPTGSVCSSYFFFPSGNGSCMQTCASNADCRNGYSCLDFGDGPICVF